MGLVEWAGNQSAWVGDSLRRIASAAHFSLSEQDEADILARVRGTAVGGGAAVPLCQPIGAAHLPGAATAADRVVLSEIGPVQHVDRLAEGQVLRFAGDGITLVFGENGSGKSGYTRIAKRFCRSISADDLKGNVFASAARPMTIHVKYRVGSANVVGLDWTPDMVTPAELRQISVFDSHNARLYVDQQNRIAYLPAEIAILEQHGVLCEKLQLQLTKEGAEFTARLKPGLPTGYTQGSVVGTLLTRLAPKMLLPERQEIESLASLNEDEEAELVRIERELADDPVVLARQRRTDRKALARVSDYFRQFDEGLSDTVASQVTSFREEAATAAAAASLAAGANFVNEPLPAVGGEAWRLLYDAALRYVASYDPLSLKLPDQPGDACLLCQQPLDGEGANRLARFNAFILGEATRRADETGAALAAAVEQIGALALPDVDVVADTLAGFAGSTSERRTLLDAILAALTTYEQRKTGLLAFAADAAATVGELPASQTAQIDAEIAALEVEAAALDAAAAHSSAIDAKRQRLANLKDRRKLGQDLAIVLQRLADLTSLAAVAACQAQLATRAISGQVSKLRRELVTEKLSERIRAEIETLDLGHIPFTFNDSSQQGKSQFGVGLQGVTGYKNNRILSEGEQRALALACFLAEIGDDDASYGLIVDDPVSSLDQQRIRRVAKRLVAEATRGRQVIIFTHSLVFFNEVVAEAARVGSKAPLLTNIIRKTEASGFGVVEQNSEPWIVRGINLRITDLRTRAQAMAAETGLDDDALRRRAKDFYSDLRESWERAVEEVVLNKTIERLVPDVKTQSLKGVAVSDEDYRTIFFAMKKASERSGHDMAAGRDIPVPTPAEMLADVEELDAFRLDYVGRRKTISAARSAMEGPVKAQVP